MAGGPSAADGWDRFARARRGPLAEGAFPSRLHGERSAALLGIALGTAFTICFVTGLMSHLIQRGPHSVQDWWPSRPVSLYRVTQGIHVLTGMAAVPLLLAKMWVAYPRLWSWPPVRDVLHAIERLALLALVGGAIFQLATGLLNVFYWYAFPFNFPLAHYAGAWIAMGGLIIHVGAKWEAARRGLARPRTEAPAGGLTRRGFLTVIGATSATILAATAGEAVGPLSRLAVLAPRRNGLGPQGVPVNHTASAAVAQAAHSPDYRLVVSGAVRRPARYSLADLRAMPMTEARLPISCVEGWSTDASWRGVRVRDLLDRAGADPGADVRVESIQTHGQSHLSTLNPNHARDPLTLLALELNGAPLHIDHGFPVRLIAPDRPGTEQTKWVARLTVL
jgi:Oxidoreductase molybdopterin binding domain